MGTVVTTLDLKKRRMSKLYV